MLSSLLSSLLSGWDVVRLKGGYNEEAQLNMNGSVNLSARRGQSRKPSKGKVSKLDAKHNWKKLKRSCRSTQRR